MLAQLPAPTPPKAKKARRNRKKKGDVDQEEPVVSYILLHDYIYQKMTRILEGMLYSNMAVQ